MAASQSDAEVHISKFLSLTHLQTGAQKNTVLGPVRKGIDRNGSIRLCLAEKLVKDSLILTEPKNKGEVWKPSEAESRHYTIFKLIVNRLTF